MSNNISFSTPQQMQHFLELHQRELESVVQTLAAITSISADQVKPYVNVMVQQLVQQQEEQPFYEKATADEWVEALRTWSLSHKHDTPLLSNAAVSREGIYADDRAI